MGPEPFWAVEASSIDAHIKSLQAEGLEVLSYFDIHAYSQYWMFPWGYSGSLTADHAELLRVSQNCTAAIRAAGWNTAYTAGNIFDVIYQVR